MNSVLKKLSRALRHPFNSRYAFKRLAEYHAKPRSLEEVVDWAMNFGGAGYMRIKTLQIPAEITRLALAVKAIEPRIILEIGTASGGTALIWSTLASERVITCDLQDMSHQAPLFTKLPPPGSTCKATLLSGDSHDPDFRARVSRELNGRQVDFLFIDGDHYRSWRHGLLHRLQGFCTAGRADRFPRHRRAPAAGDQSGVPPVEASKDARFGRGIRQRPEAVRLRHRPATRSRNRRAVAAGVRHDRTTS